MTKSMTAYGRTSGEIQGLHWTIEIHSVNQRGLNMSLHMPKEWLCFDIDIRKWITEFIGRGQVTVKILVKTGSSGSKIYLESLRELKERWQQIAEELGYSRKSVDLPFLAKQIESGAALDFVKDEEAMRKELKTLFLSAMDQLMKMKLFEGKQLSQEIQARLEKIQKELETITQRAHAAPLKYKEKLEANLKGLLQGAVLEESRMYQEVALIAERVDITEELDRLNSHLKQLFELFKGKEKSIGRTADFLLQEMGREVHTVGAKSDLEIAKLCIGVKGELEKIKEQVQNLE